MRHPMLPGLTFDQVKRRYEVEVGQAGRHMDICEVVVYWAVNLEAQDRP